MEIGKRRTSRWIRISIIVVPKAIVDCETVSYAPGVLSKNAKGALGILILTRHRLACNRIVGKTALGIRVVIDQVNHAVVLKIWLSIGRSKEGQIISVPAFHSHTDGMFSLNPCENIAPVIIVFSILGISKTNSPTNAKIVHIHNWNRKQTFLRIRGLQIVIAKKCLVQRVC